MPTVMPNVTSAIATAPEPPLRDGKEPYRFEMVFDGGTKRGYADTSTELLAFLIRGYQRFSPAQALAARLHHAVRTQVTVQADINYDDRFDQCSPEEQVILQGHRNTPPDTAVWNCPIPLVLIDTYYEPQGNLPAPVSGISDVADPPNLLWLRPYDEFEYLISLHRVGLIALSERD